MFPVAPFHPLPSSVGSCTTKGYYPSTARKPKQRPDDPAQSKRFIETAELVSADDEEAPERALKKIRPTKDRSAQDRKS